MAVVVPSGASAAQNTVDTRSIAPRIIVPEGRYLGDLSCERGLIRVYAGAVGARFELCEPTGRPVAEPVDRHALFEQYPWLRLERFDPKPASGLEKAFARAIAARP